MNKSNISKLRLINQQIAAPQFTSAKGLVGWMGAMQAQDFPMSKWAVGLRLPHSTESEVEAAFNRGDILRTHVMRPTWHMVSADDIYWMIELTAPQIKSQSKSRNRDLGLTDEVLSASRKALEKALQGNRALTRDEISDHLNQSGITTEGQRIYHILMEAEIEGLICSGPVIGKNQTYMLLEERVPKKHLFSKEEALALLARKYFSSHGPATLADFVWWSGLRISDARKAIEINQSTLLSAEIDQETYWFTEPLADVSFAHDSVYLLPAFDEYLIAYQNRSAAIAIHHRTKAISNNGIFRPIVVVNGQISGLWKRSFTKNSVVIELDHFRPHNKKEVQLIEKASEKYGYFSARNAVLKPK